MKKKKDSMDKALDILNEYNNEFEPRSIQDYGCFCGIESKKLKTNKK